MKGNLNQSQKTDKPIQPEDVAAVDDDDEYGDEYYEEEEEEEEDDKPKPMKQQPVKQDKFETMSSDSMSKIKRIVESQARIPRIIVIKD